MSTSQRKRKRERNIINAYQPTTSNKQSHQVYHPNPTDPLDPADLTDQAPSDPAPADAVDPEDPADPVYTADQTLQTRQTLHLIDQAPSDPVDPAPADPADLATQLGESKDVTLNPFKGVRILGLRKQKRRQFTSWMLVKVNYKLFPRVL